MQDLTIEVLSQIYATTPQATLAPYIEPLNFAFKEYEFNTLNRQAMFLAQTAAESGCLTQLEENLHYSATRLMQVWPHLFPTQSIAGAYANQPEKIANHVYANRYGNGNEASGDGWKFRGRGAFQLTFQANYADWGKSLDKTADEAVEYILTPIGVIYSASWFCEDKDINRYSDNDDIQGATLAINGGLNGLATRINFYHRAKQFLVA